MYQIRIPTFHPGQLDAWSQRSRFQVVRCGRRWGKTKYGLSIACSDATIGRRVGFFAPDYKILSETFSEMEDVLEPIIVKSNQKEGLIKTRGGGRIELWSLVNERAGRSRKYHRAIIDEAAFAQPHMMQTWNTSIKPTLLDYAGSCLVLSNTNGYNPDNFLWRLCNEPIHGFTDFHAPTSSNPHLPPEEIAKLKLENPPLVYAQEYEAQFVDWTGVQFFDIANMFFDDGISKAGPVGFPTHCDGVFATIDTATKTGAKHDGTGVIFWAKSSYGQFPLVLLDYDYVQIEGGSLVEWLPSVATRLLELSEQCGARTGEAGGIHIEDKNSGSVLIQQCNVSANPTLRNVHAIDSKLTSWGKDERAIAVSKHVYTNKVKISKHAFEKNVTYKMKTRNHLVTQVISFRIGDEDPKREDDLLDCFCYGIAMALGNAEGF